MRVLAFDFGASTGRALVGEVRDGLLEYSEINRFDNTPYTKNGHMYWDFSTLWNNVKASIKMAGDIDSIGIDTWGVDYGIIDKNGVLKGDPHHYRDARTLDTFKKIAGKDDLYKQTGIQVMNINTMFQLLCEVETNNLEVGDKILFMPDLFAYMLTGTIYSEYTIATTSGLVNPKTKNWNTALIEKLNLPKDIFAPIINAGDEYGLLTDDLKKEFNLTHDVKVTAVCTHDTASAITAMVTSPKDSIYVSCGTWSLMGIERDDVDTSDERFTNEGGYKGSITYLSNIMGLWLIQEFRRKLMKETGKSVSFKQLEQMMNGTKEGEFVVDTNDESFLAPKDMEQAIIDYVKKTGQGEISSRGQVVRCIYDSLAEAYRKNVEALNKKFNNKYKTINILGGGSQALPLVYRTQKLTNLKVVAGPVEATAIGNLLVQLIALGDIKDIDEGREIVARTEKVKVFV